MMFMTFYKGAMGNQSSQSCCVVGGHCWLLGIPKDSRDLDCKLPDKYQTILIILG